MLTFRKRHPGSGARPGTLMVKDSPPPELSGIRFNKSDFHESQLENLEQIEFPLSGEHVHWINISGFGDKSLLKNVSERFDIHPLAMESVVNIPQRAKLEVFDHQILIVMKMIRVVGSQVDIEQVSILFGDNYVISFQERSGDVFEPLRKRLRTGGSSTRSYSTDFLAYALIDAVVDGYYPVLESIGDAIDPLEDQVIHSPDPEILSEVHQMKNQLVNLRRALWPQREAILSFIHVDHPLVSDAVRVYLRDTYDHCVQTTEVAEMYREMTGGLLNTYLSSVANRTNDVMKVLTIVSTIFIPLTFLAGIYGMNFEYIPELKFRYGYAFFWGAMLTISFTLIWFFFRNGWLGSGKEAQKESRQLD